MKILALDFGGVRIGTAMGESDLGIAFPREILGNDENTAEHILELCSSERIERVLVGLPILPGGSESAMTEKARIFAENLEDFFVQKNCSIPVDFCDETYSSRSARQSAQKCGVSERGMRGKTDSVAAAIFLQTVFDQGNFDF